MVLQALFFTSDSITYAQGFLYMGLTALAASFVAFTIRWPMWGGMLPWTCRKGPAPGECTEEAYFSRDYTEGEQRLGTHGSTLRFVSRRGRGGVGRTRGARAAVPGRRWCWGAVSGPMDSSSQRLCACLSQTPCSVPPAPLLQAAESRSQRQRPNGMAARRNGRAASSKGSEGEGPSAAHENGGESKPAAGTRGGPALALPA